MVLPQTEVRGNNRAQGESHARGQNFAPTTVFALVRSFASTTNELPFWLTANQAGAVPWTSSPYQLLQVGVARVSPASGDKKWGWAYGAAGDVGYGQDVMYKVNHAYVALQYKGIELKAGSRPVGVLYSGLSSTNGNLMLSGNARPLPGVSLSSARYLPFPVWKKYLAFRFLYEENLLPDHRRETDVRLHHKQFVLRAGKEASLTVSAGVDHWVYWGGTTPVHGEQPGWEAYLRYVTGQKGNNSFHEGDQINVAGNGLGMHLVSLTKRWGRGTLDLYWNHPFEDRSGMLFWNKKDGLWGVTYAVSHGERPLLSRLLYEYMYTLHQSGSRHMVPDPKDPTRLIGKGGDNYFNHGIYTTGHLYDRRMIGSPLFIPVTGSDGYPSGYANNRIVMHHGGAAGYLGRQLAWKALLTWSRSYGKYSAPLPDPQEQLSGLCELHWSAQRWPVEVRLGLAADRGQRFDDRFGGYLGMVWRINSPGND